MKLTAPLSKLRPAIARAYASVDPRSTLPVLSTLLLTAEGNTLTLTGSNLDQMATVPLEVAVAKPGRICLPARRFSDIAKVCTGADLALEVDGLAVKIEANGAKFALAGLDGVEFPEHLWVETGDVKSWKFDLATLRADVARVARSQSDDATRYVLNGVFFDAPAKGGLSYVATNGRVLSVVQTDNPGPLAGFIMPRKFVDLVLKMEAEGQGTLKATSNAVTLETEAGTVSSKLIEGNFPNYRTLLPESCKGSMELPRLDFLAEINRACAIGESKEGGHAPILDFTGLGVEVTATNGEGHTGTAGLMGKVSGDSVRIKLSRAYLEMALVNLPDDVARLEWNDKGSAMCVRAGNCISVVMPMRVDA